MANEKKDVWTVVLIRCDGGEVNTEVNTFATEGKVRSFLKEQYASTFSNTTDIFDSSFDTHSFSIVYNDDTVYEGRIHRSELND